MENPARAFATRTRLARERIEAMKDIWTQSRRVSGDVRQLRPDEWTWRNRCEKAHLRFISAGGSVRRRAGAVRYGDGFGVDPLAGRATQYGECSTSAEIPRNAEGPGAIRDVSDSLFGSTEDGLIR